MRDDAEAGGGLQVAVIQFAIMTGAAVGGLMFDAVGWWSSFAFAASNRYDISGARILLVDDVITTGATCDSAARALLNAGAATVYAVSVARGSGMWN